jgi:hypothetical protein
MESYLSVRIDVFAAIHRAFFTLFAKEILQLIDLGNF